MWLNLSPLRLFPSHGQAGSNPKGRVADHPGARSCGARLSEPIWLSGPVFR
jgi:hypothetical protein